jgi:hypothetical protein
MAGFTTQTEASTETRFIIEVITTQKIEDEG